MIRPAAAGLTATSPGGWAQPNHSRAAPRTSCAPDNQEGPMRLFSRRPSAAFIVAVFALCFAVVGSAIAGTDSEEGAVEVTGQEDLQEAGRQGDQQEGARALGRARDQRRHRDLGDQRVHGDERQFAVDLRARQHHRPSSPNVDESRSKGLADADFKDVGSAGRLLREPTVVQDIQRGDRRADHLVRWRRRRARGPGRRRVQWSRVRPGEHDRVVVDTTGGLHGRRLRPPALELISRAPAA